MPGMLFFRVSRLILLGNCMVFVGLLNCAGVSIVVLLCSFDSVGGCCCLFLIICSNPLRASLQNLERTSDSLILRRSHEKPERTSDFDCTLCMKLLYAPITTPCGHTFCRLCLFQTMDRSKHLAVVDLSFR